MWCNFFFGGVTDATRIVDYLHAPTDVILLILFTPNKDTTRPGFQGNQVLKLHQMETPQALLDIN